MDDVLSAAFSHADIQSFLREGDHALDEIYEGTLHREPVAEIQTPADLN